MTFRRLITAFTFLALLAMATRVSIDSDTWWHLKAGAWMAENGAILRHDPFSLTRQGQTWIYPGWLAQLLLWGTYQLLDLGGLIMLTALIVTLAFAFVWPLLEGPYLLRSAILLLAAVTSGVYWSARPQILTFLLTGVSVFILASARNHADRRLWLLPLVLAVWANLHGGFFTGFLLLAAYLAAALLEWAWPRLLRIAKFQPAPDDALADEDPNKLGSWIGRLSLVGLFSALAISINPHGPRMLLYPFQTVSIGVLRDYIEEWQSPNFHRTEVLPFLAFFMLLLVAFAWSRKRVRLHELFLVAGFGVLSFFAGRNIALFALVSAPILGRHTYAALKPLLDRRPLPKPFNPRLQIALNWLLFTLIALTALIKIASVLPRTVIDAALEETHPTAAFDWIESHQPPGPIFNSYNWGGYIIWRLYPQYLSFVDGRTDLFGNQILNDYLQAWRADPGWEQVLDHWNIQSVLIEPYAPLARALEASHWRRVYVDDQAIVLIRIP